MDNPDFWDFMLEGGDDLLFSDDEDRTIGWEHCIVTSDKVMNK